MKWSLALPWPLLLLMCPDITGAALALQKGLGSFRRAKEQNSQKLGSSETSTDCGYLAEGIGKGSLPNLSP